MQGGYSREPIAQQLPEGGACEPAAVRKTSCVQSRATGTERTQFQEGSGVPTWGRDRNWRVEP